MAMIDCKEKDAVTSGGIAPVETLIKDARAGKMMVIIDRDAPTATGFLYCSAMMADAAAITFMAIHGRGLVCLALTGERVRELGLPAMSRERPRSDHGDFTVSIEAREGVTTGISAADRARTIAVASDAAFGREDIVTPGHVFPMIAAEGGVLSRAGRAEAAVDMARLANLTPAGVTCDIMSRDGSIAQLPELMELAQTYGLNIGTIEDLIAYRRRHEELLDCIGTHRLDSEHGGEWTLRILRNRLEGIDCFALVKGEMDSSAPAIVRLHVGTILDDLLGRKGDRTHLLQAAMKAIGSEGSGIIVFVAHRRSNTFADVLDSESKSADQHLLRPTDARREFATAAQVLKHFGVTRLVELCDPKKDDRFDFASHGFTVVATRDLIRELPAS